MYDVNPLIAEKSELLRSSSWVVCTHSNRRQHIMGWTGTTRYEYQTDREFFAGEFRDCRIIDLARRGSVVYMALEHNLRPGEVWGEVCLTERDRNQPGYFYYKDINEAMGPVESNCPVRIIKKLSPATEPYAIEWRARCLQNAAAEAVARKQRRRLAVGDLLTFDHPLKFTDGHIASRFVLAAVDRPVVAKSLENDRMYRLSRLSRLKYTVERLTKETAHETGSEHRQ
jgi:hypothetical protein